MNEKALYYSMLLYFLQHTNLRLEKRDENSAWFRDENNTVFVLERNEFPWKKQYMERTQKFVSELLTKYAGKIQPPEVIRMTFTTRVPYEYTDLKDMVRFKSGHMRHYIVSEKISKEKFEELGSEVFGLADQNKYIADRDQVDKIEKDFQHIPISNLDETQPGFKNEKNFYFAKKAIINPIFMVIIILSFIFWQKMNSEDTLWLIDVGAKFNPLIQDGEWWRLFTPVLLHGGWMHLGMNMLAMYYIGQDVERFYGKWRYIVIFLLAAAGGSISSYIFSTEVSVGASGAIFGLFGALLYTCQYYKDVISSAYRKNMFLLVAVNLGFGLLVPGIDMSAHIGGFIIGYLAGYVLNFPKNRPTMKRGLLGIVGLALLFSFYYVGDMKNAADPENSWKAGNYYFEKEDYQSAYRAFQKSLTQGMEETEEVNFMIGYTEVQLQMYDASIQSFEKVIQENDRNEEAYYKLALIYGVQQKYDQALASIQKALSYYPKNQKYLDLQAYLLREQKAHGQ